MFVQSNAALFDLNTMLEPVMSLVIGVLVLVLIVEAIVLIAEVLATLPERRRARAARDEAAQPPSSP